MNARGERILILGDSLSHVGLDAAPTVAEITQGSARRSAAPGDLLGSMLLEQGAQAVRVNAKVGRSAISFWGNEPGASLVAGDSTWRPSKVIVMLGTNDTQRDPAKTEIALAQIRDSYANMGAEVWAVGPFVYIGRGAVLNAPADRVFGIMQRVFGADRTIDARPITITEARAGDGIHFTATSAPPQAQQLVTALLAKNPVPIRKPIVAIGLGFGAVLLVGLAIWGVKSKISSRGISGRQRSLRAATDDDDDGGDEWFTRLRAKQAKSLDEIKAKLKTSPALIGTWKHGGKRLLLVTGEMQSGKGGYRVTTFADDGPSGHASRSTMDEIADEIRQDGFESLRPASDDEVMAWTSSPEFVEGSKRVAFVQAINTLSFRAGAKGNGDVAREVERAANKLAAEGKWDDATLILQRGIKDLGRHAR